MLADGAHQEDGDDIGEDDGDDAAGGAAADVEAEPRGAVDQERQVGGGVARAAVGGDEDLGKDPEQEDGLDQDDDGDRPRQVRQHQVDEAADEAGAVHLGGLLLLAVERLQRGEQDQRGEGQPLPGDDEDDREQRVLRRTSRSAAAPKNLAMSAKTP